MDGRAASQTITDKVPFLLEQGWKIYVLSAITGSLDYRFPHRRLFAVGPSAFRFDIRHWCALQFGRDWRYYLITFSISLVLLPLITLERFFVGLSSQWSWTISATICSLVWSKKYDINLIYTSGGAWSAHAAGWCLKRLTGIKWIAEIHDPLVERYTKDDDGSGLRLNRETCFRRALERQIYKDSDFCWWFTEGALKYARLRNIMLGAKGSYLLPGALPPKVRLPYKPRSKLHLAHFGSLSESRSLAPLIRGLATFLLAHPEAVDKIRLEVFGTSLDSLSQHILKDLKLENVIACHGRLEYNSEIKLSGRDQVLRVMQQSDYLLLLHGFDESCAEYIPSKLYEYWWANRPILALTHRNPQLDKLIYAISPKNFVGQVSDGDQAIQALLRHAWSQWRANETAEFNVQQPPLSPRDAVIEIDRVVKQNEYLH